MRYISTTIWRDLTDGHLYQDGESFPHDGRELPADRVESLLKGNNRAGIALIRPAKEEVREIITETPEATKKASRGRKKAVQ